MLGPTLVQDRVSASLPRNPSVALLACSAGIRYKSKRLALRGTADTLKLGLFQL